MVYNIWDDTTMENKMGWMKRWLWELIESGEVEYLIDMGAPNWAIEEAEYFAQYQQEDKDGDAKGY